MAGRLFASIYVGLLIYLVVTFFFGGTGHFSYQSLSQQYKIIEKNVEDLKTQGRTLGYSVTALRSDPGSIVREARRLLLLHRNEGFIRIEGYKAKPRPLSPGRLVVLKKESGLRLEPFLRAFAAISGILVFLFYKRQLRRKP
ncbi:MAG: septum formation initiator family protein [Spirochaetales bacterium]|jgi:cell division protein FtsB|nr:septum formation initiator family protein [Spirochaetales bacterium]